MHGDTCVKTYREEQIELKHYPRESGNLKDGESTETINYEYYKTRTRHPSYEFHSQQVNGRFERQKLLTEIVKKESPINIEIAYRRLVSIWGIEKIGSRIQETLDETLRECRAENSISKKGNFL